MTTQAVFEDVRSYPDIFMDTAYIVFVLSICQSLAKSVMVVGA